MKLADRKELGEQLAGFVYGTIVVLSVIVTGAKAFPHDWAHSMLVAVTTIVFWLAHVYAHVLAFSIGHDAHLSLGEFGHIARREASILAAGVPPEAALVLGGIGVLSAILRSGSRLGLDWPCSGWRASSSRASSALGACGGSWRCSRTCPSGLC